MLVTDKRRETSVVSAISGSAESAPIWLMRQAGRYLPEYRKIRAQSGSFLELCYNPELAAEVTLQPIKRFDFDAAILFSDILVVADALGRDVRFVEGDGPQLNPLEISELDGLDASSTEFMFEPVYEAARLVRANLAPSKSLIGFCGAPWTVATYMIAGRGTKDQAPARLMAAQHPEALDRLLDILVTVSADYLVGQLRAGANVVQVFDSWAGVLDEVGFQRWCIEPTAEIVSRVKQKIPDAVVIGFPKGAGLMLERYAAQSGVDAVGLDWTVPLTFARERLQPSIAVQGCLDPLTLLAGGQAMDDAVDRIMAALSQGRFIFNLGHGIVPETPIAHVERLVDRVRSWPGAAS